MIEQNKRIINHVLECRDQITSTLRMSASNFRNTIDEIDLLLSDIEYQQEAGDRLNTIMVSILRRKERPVIANPNEDKRKYPPPQKIIEPKLVTIVPQNTANKIQKPKEEFVPPKEHEKEIKKLNDFLNGKVVVSDKVKNFKVPSGFSPEAFYKHAQEFINS